MIGTTPRRWRAIGIACLAAILGCSDASGPAAPPSGAVDLSVEWSVASPASQGLDAARVSAAIAHAGGVANLWSLLVVRNGQLVVERYFHGSTADSLNHLRSGTKSVISALVGIAIGRGEIASVTGTLGALVPPSVAPLDAARAAITARQLLTMSSGFQWTESGAIGYNDWILSADHVRFLTDRPLVDPPGTRFNYNSAGAHLLSVVIAGASQLSTAEYASRHLFAPLGIPRWRWEVLSGGYHNGGAGLELRARDMAKFGQLFLQRGRSGNRQVVPSDWIDESTAQRFRFGQSGAVRDLGYGYLWWTEQGLPNPAYFAWGYGGQFIYIVPARGLVIVATSDFRGLGSTAGAQGNAILDLIINHVLPAAS